MTEPVLRFIGWAFVVLGCLFGLLSLRGGAAYYVLPATLAVVSGVLFVALARLMDILWGIRWKLEEQVQQAEPK